MRNFWIADRIENTTKSGVADIIYSCMGKRGFIELKYLKEWPKRPDTPVKIPHLTEIQRAWLSLHEQEANLCFILLQIEKDYLLYSAKRIDDLGIFNKKTLFYFCVASWHKQIDFKELANCLQKRKIEKDKLIKLPKKDRQYYGVYVKNKLHAVTFSQSYLNALSRAFENDNYKAVALTKEKALEERKKLNKLKTLK